MLLGNVSRPYQRRVACLIVRVHVVSDVHGNADELARAGAGADALLVLGDLIDFVNSVPPLADIAAAQASGVRQRIEVSVQCAQCGQQTTVPFYPSQGRPVYCRSCFLAGHAAESASV